LGSYCLSAIGPKSIIGCLLEAGFSSLPLLSWGVGGRWAVRVSNLETEIREFSEHRWSLGGLGEFPRVVLFGEDCS
jgi:hypothetical protein